MIFSHFYLQIYDVSHITSSKDKKTESNMCQWFTVLLSAMKKISSPTYLAVKNATRKQLSGATRTQTTTYGDSKLVDPFA